MKLEKQVIFLLLSSSQLGPRRITEYLERGPGVLLSHLSIDQKGPGNLPGLIITSMHSIERESTQQKHILSASKGNHVVSKLQIYVIRGDSW